MVTLVVLAMAGVQFLRMEHLCLAAPEGYEFTRRRGPDFALFYVNAPSEKGHVGFYLGNHPGAFDMKGAKGRSVKFRMGHRRAKWQVWTQNEGSAAMYRAQAIIERPFRIQPEYSTYLHVFVSAPTEEDRAALLRFAEQVQPAAGEPRCPEFAPWTKEEY